MLDWELRNPSLLALALAAPLVYWLASRASASVTYSDLRLFAGTPRSVRARLAKLPAALLAIAAAALAVAVAGPRVGDARTVVSREGIAIVMVVDHSGSMRALDFERDGQRVDRLAVVKEVFREFVLGGAAGKGRTDDLIGLVGFARYADGLCPLTLDHGSLVQILEDLEIAKGGDDGTAVGEGLGLAVERLRRREDIQKVAILLTDGVSNAGDLDPLEAAELAVAHDIKVYCIGIGSTGFATFPEIDRTTGDVVVDAQGRPLIHPRAMRVELDEKTLKAIADRTGGRYYNARSTEALAEVYREIDQLERRKVTEVRFLQYEEKYPWFVGAALACLAFAGALGGTFLRRLP
ncbi:MAG: VWA domain-containing protein [Planctomycetota bacterium]